jgi:hypothetical protein
MANGGYQADSQAMADAGVKLSNAAGDTTAKAAKVGPTQLTQQEFGRVHGAYFNDYKAGIDTMVAAMKGLAGALTNLGGGIGSASGAYQTADANAAASAQNAGNS